MVLLIVGPSFLHEFIIERGLLFLLCFDINARNMAAAHELNLMLLFVQWVIVSSGIFGRVPIEHKFSVILASLSFLPLFYTKVSFLK